MEKVFLKECFLTDIIKYDALSVWEKLEVGTSLEFVYELVPFNEAKKCVFACLKKKEQKHRIGCLSKDDSSMIAQLISMGWNDVLICYISHIDKSAPNDQYIKIAIYIQKCPKS